MAGERTKAEDLFARWQGKKAGKVWEVDLPNLGETVVELGIPLRIEYASDKHGGEPTHFYHNFDLSNPPILAANAEGTMLVIFGGGLQVTEDGVEG